MEVPKAAFYQVEAVQEIGEDRGGGFGSTGLLIMSRIYIEDIQKELEEEKWKLVSEEYKKLRFRTHFSLPRRTSCLYFLEKATK